MENLKIIVAASARELGDKVHAHLKKIRKENENYLVPNDLVRFANGEGKAKLSESVRGQDVFILSDIGNYSITYNLMGKEVPMSPDEHFTDIKRIIASIRGNAERITVVMPLLYESRQHARNGRESLDCALALQELAHMGVHNIVTFDAHDPNVINAIPLISFDNFFPTNTILKDFIKDEKIDFDKLLIISPDEGAMKRSRFYSAMLRCDIGMFYKQRDYSILENGKHPIKEHKYLGRDVEGLDCVIIDDILASGNSITDILNQLNPKKPNSISAIVTFAAFTEGTEKFDEAYRYGVFHKIYSTNLSYVPEYIINKPWFEHVDCSKYVAEVINCYYERQSVAPLLNGRKEMFDEIEKRKEKNRKAKK